MKSIKKLSPALEDSTRGASLLHPLRVLITLALATIATVLVWIIPLRPTFSAFEQRELAKFPAFSWEALTSGSYFDDISLWFSDTFPAREQFVQLNGNIRAAYGIQREIIYGNVAQGDEIPTAPTRPPAITITTTTGTGMDNTTTTVTSGTTTTGKPIDPDILQQNQSLGAIIVKGDTAYEYYNFVRAATDRYIAAINYAGAVCSDAQVYSMVVPTSIDIMLPESEHPANSSDQGKAIAYIYGSLAQNIHTVNVRDSLLSHRGEYLYFHTDHHWTARGAYYAYAEFARIKGIDPLPLSTFEEQAYPGFLGSFYAQTQNANLKLSADTVYAYKPQGDISMVIGKSPTEASGYPLLMDVTNWSSRYKYNTFVGGDNAYTCITNNSITDGSSIVLVKDSYGNAFAPYLATMYHKVYLLDFRHFTGDFGAFVQQNAIGDVLLLNNLSATRNNALVDKMNTFVGNG